MVCCSTASKGVPWEQSAGGCPSSNPRETADNWGAVAKKSLQAISGIGDVRIHEVYRVPACEIGIEAGGSQ